MLYLAIYAYTYMCVYMHATAINLKRAHEFENIMQEYMGAFRVWKEIGKMM